MPRIHTFAEPFAGGANVGLFLLAQRHVERLILIEKDRQLLDIWYTILVRPDELTARIQEFVPTTENLLHTLQVPPRCKVDRAFHALLRNRVARGGVLAKSGGILNRGENDSGVFSRWYPATLIHRIQCIGALASQIELIEGDGIASLLAMKSDPKIGFLVDPPYSGFGKAAGRRLYSHWEIDHWKLFDVCGQLAGPFLLTYEDTIEIELLAIAHDLSITRVPMRNSHNKHVLELIASKNLGAISED